MATSSLFQFCNNNNGSIVEDWGIPSMRTLDKSIFILTSALGISLFILSLACLFFNCLLRHNRIIKMSSPRLNMVIACGGILSSVCCVLEGMDFFLVVDSHVSHVVCQLRYGLLSISFTLMFGPMVGRTWRVNRIFKMAGYKRVVIRDQRLLLYTALLVFVDIIMCVVWYFVDPVKFQHTTRLAKINTDPCLLGPPDIVVVPACSSEWPTLWSACFLAIKLPFLIVGLRESWWTKGDLLPAINDSASLVVSILATVVMATLAALTSQAFEAHPDVTKACVVGCVWLATSIAVAAVFVPKLLLWKRTPDGRVNRMSISSTSSTKAVLHSFGQLEAELSTANTEIETLKDFIREKENSIEKLQRLLSDAEENLTQFNIDNAMTSPTLDQSEYGNEMPKEKVKECVLWLGGDHADCPGLQDHEDYCSCNNSVDNDKLNITKNSSNNNQRPKLIQPPQQQLKSILHTTTENSISSSASSVTNSEALQSAVNNGQNLEYAKTASENNFNDSVIDSGDKYNNGNHLLVANDQSRYLDYQNHRFNSEIQTRNSKNQEICNNNNKLSIMEKPILKRCTSPLNGNHYHKNSSISGGRNLTSVDNYNNNIISNKIIDTKIYNSSTSNNPTLPLSNYSIDQHGRSPLFFNTNDTNTPLTALQKRYLRRRRSSTSSIASLSKLNRLRSDLSNALQISQALSSGWCKDFDDMERYKRQVKMARRARRKSMPGFQNIADSIMASYNFQRTVDNETFISDCLSSSEWSSDVTRNSKMSLASSSQSSRSVNKGRRHSECNFYFPYDRSGRLDDVNIRLDVINNSKDYRSAMNNREFDFNVIPTINEPINENYDVMGDVRSQRGLRPLGTISGRIGPAALYGHSEYDQFQNFRNVPRDREYPDVFEERYYNETASDFLGPTTPRPVLTSDSLYPPPERQRRWSGGTEGVRRKDDFGFNRRESGRRGGIHERFAPGRDAGIRNVYDKEEFVNGGRLVDRMGGRGNKGLSPFYIGSGTSGDQANTLAVPDIRGGNTDGTVKGNGVTFADVVTSSHTNQRRDVSGFMTATDNNSLSTRPKFHRSISDNILSRYESREVGCASFGNARQNERKHSGEYETRFNTELISTLGECQGRGTTADIHSSDRRVAELSIVPKEMPLRDSLRHEDMGSQININVTVGSRAREHNGHIRQGMGHKQSYA